MLMKFDICQQSFVESVRNRVSVGDPRSSSPTPRNPGREDTKTDVMKERRPHDEKREEEMSKKRKKEEAGKSTNVSHPSVAEGERKKERKK
jgi:hypothetical protein